MVTPPPLSKQKPCYDATKWPSRGSVVSSEKAVMGVLSLLIRDSRESDPCPTPSSETNTSMFEP